MSLCGSDSGQYHFRIGKIARSWTPTIALHFLVFWAIFAHPTSEENYVPWLWSLECDQIIPYWVLWPLYGVFAAVFILFIGIGYYVGRVGEPGHVTDTVKGPSAPKGDHTSLKIYADRPSTSELRKESASRRKSVATYLREPKKHSSSSNSPGKMYRVPSSDFSFS